MFVYHRWIAGRSKMILNGIKSAGVKTLLGENLMIIYG